MPVVTIAPFSHFLSTPIFTGWRQGSGTFYEMSDTDNWYDLFVSSCEQEAQFIQFEYDFSTIPTGIIEKIEVGFRSFVDRYQNSEFDVWALDHTDNDPFTLVHSIEDEEIGETNTWWYELPTTNLEYNSIRVRAEASLVSQVFILYWAAFRITYIDPDPCKNLDLAEYVRCHIIQSLSPNCPVIQGNVPTADTYIWIHVNRVRPSLTNTFSSLLTSAYIDVECVSTDIDVAIDFGDRVKDLFHGHTSNNNGTFLADYHSDTYRPFNLSGDGGVYVRSVRVENLS